MKTKAILSTGTFVIPATILWLTAANLLAVPVDQFQAERAVKGWLKQNPSPMEKAIGKFSEIQTYVDEYGKPLYYVVSLRPEGFAVLSPDDEVEPVIAFSSSGAFVEDENNPLKALLEKDMRGRIAAAGADDEQLKPQKMKSSAKWNALLKAGVETGEISPAGIGGVSLIYVDPFVQSLWDQGNVISGPCYNYHTPNYYPCGCVATAMAQLMRYYQWPTAGIGYNAFTITVDGSPRTAYTRGGDGSGGAYNWTQMPLNPQAGVTNAERAMIGALCSDAGVSVGMSYTDDGSSASLYYADQRFTGTFMYTNSIYAQPSSVEDSHFANMVQSNLDAQMPVILGVRGTAGGHAIIADGYGYNGGELYHHLNMGWSGSDNAWYNLPLIETYYYTFNVVDDCIYNVYTDGSGEIISGRVTNLAGAPLSYVTVRAYFGATLVKETTTNSRGVYALTKLTGNRAYRVSASKTGESFLDQNVSVGSSVDQGTPGNRSGILFVSAVSGPPTAYDVQAQTPSTTPVTIQLSALDDGDPNLLQYIVTSLPQHGTLYDPNVGPIDSVPYSMLASDANGITYTPCPYFGGEDTFTYKANDGGSYPTGGDSNIATVAITVNNKIETTFAPITNSIAGWPFEASETESRVDVIYLSGNVGQARNLTGIALNIYQAPGQTLNNFKIRMKHTTKGDFSTTYNFENTGWTQVYQANEAISSTGWRWFNFSTPFAFNGTQNLMVDFSFRNSSVSSDGTCFVSDTGAERVNMSYSLSGDPLTWTMIQYSSNSVPNCKFTGLAAITPIAGDFDATCSVKLPDVAIFAQAWQTVLGQSNYDAACDLTTTKGTINLADLIILTDHWLETYP